MTYKEARVYLDEMSKYGSVLGLEAIRGLLRELGNPQNDLKFIHIAGTNGKGSVLAYTSTILSEAGYRIGRYVSPTVVSYLERIQVDGEWISETEFAEVTENVRDAVARLEAAGEPVPTVFETETAMAFLYFRKKKCDLAVIEAGLGGALDATNIIQNTVCAVFASISRDHLGVIGNSLEEIAENKAGIIKPGCAVVSAFQRENVEAILKEQAQSLGCPYIRAEQEETEIIREDYRGITFSYKEFRNIHTSMAGRNQTGNAATALETIRTLRRLGYDAANCIVLEGMTIRQEADYFRRQNENKQSLRINDTFNASLWAEDAESLRIKELMDQYGFRHGKSGQPMCICAIGALQRILRRFGDRTLELTLACIAATWPHDSTILRGEMLAGLGEFWRRYSEKLTVAQFEARMRKHLPMEMYQEARRRTQGKTPPATAFNTNIRFTMCAVYVSAYNKQLRTNSPNRLELEWDHEDEE